MPNNLQGKRALVTGAAGGIGLAIAGCLVERGAVVMLCGRTEETLAKAAATLEAPYIRCDVTSPDDVRAAIEATVDAFGGIDVLVNNAGIEYVAPLIEHDEDSFDTLLAVNIKGTFLGIKYGAPAIISSGGGAIINIGAAPGLAGASLLGGYGATKAAIASLTQTAAVELRDHGVRVVCVCPGFIDTPMAARVSAAMAGPIQQSLGRDLKTVMLEVQARLGLPREVAETVAYLAGDQASFLNGVVLPIDNALTARLI